MRSSRVLVSLAVLTAGLACFPAIALAQESGGKGIEWTKLVLTTIGGLALFLFGIDQLSRHLREAAGDRFRKVLEASSQNRFAGLAAGTAVTVALDSSSATIIILIALVDAGLLTFPNALPVILGSNIGTTFSSQIFAWGADDFAPILLAGGFVWRVLDKSEERKRWASSVLALGLVLFALHIIGDAAEPLKKDKRIIDWVRAMGETPILGVLAGAAATIAIQSSSAMMGIVIVLASEGLIGLPAGIAIMLGAEIGTCADTLVASIGRSAAAVRAGLFHLVFNVASVAVGIALVGPLAALAASTAGAPAQQIANAHVIFNVVGALAFLPLVRTAAAMLERVVPGREDASGGRRDARAPA
jgi:phosphate:Na+ symporter